MAKNIKFLPVVLWFYTTDITQAQAVAAQEHWDNADVHFRLNAGVKLGDILEKFDGLAGEAPAAYIADATARGKQYIPCTIAEVVAGTAPKFNDFVEGNTNPAISPMVAPVTINAQSVPDGTALPTVQDTESTTVDAPVVTSSTIQAPTDNNPAVIGNPATSAQT